MRKIVYSILIVSFVFLLNIGLYFYSDSYSFFLKKIKYWEETSLVDKWLITDDYLLNNIWDNLSCDCEQICQQNNENQNTNTENTIQNVDDLVKNEVEIQKQDYDKINNFMQRFASYNLSEKAYDEYYKIFDVTDEYPNKYVTFSNNDLEIYFFPYSKFDDLYNIFDLLKTDELVLNKFDLNKTNNFKKQSFFINFKTQDDFVRLVIDDWNILFWLKMKKSYYWDIKKILQNF